MTVVLPAEVLALALIAIAAMIFAILLFAIRQWQELVVAIARRKIFEARDEIFFLFAESGVGVGHPAHRELRELLNLIIRYAHKMTWWRLIFMKIFLAKSRAFGRVRLPSFMDLAATDRKLFDNVGLRLHDVYHTVFQLMSRRLLPVPVITLIDRASDQAIRKLRVETPASDAAVDKIALAAAAGERELACGRLKAA